MGTDRRLVKYAGPTAKQDRRVLKWQCTAREIPTERNRSGDLSKCRRRCSLPAPCRSPEQQPSNSRLTLPDQATLQHRIMVAAAAVQRLEIRNAVISAHHHLAIDQEGL